VVLEHSSTLRGFFARFTEQGPPNIDAHIKIESERGMIEGFTVVRRRPGQQRPTDGRRSWVEIMEAQVPPGEWVVPVVNERRVALALSGFSAISWRGSRSPVSGDVSAGMMGICELNQPHRFEMRNPASFAIVLLRNELLEQAIEDTRQTRTELKPLQTVQDEIMRHLMEVLLYEMRGGFESGAFFLDGVSAALASHLVRRYGVDPPVERESIGGLAPSVLRRSIEQMEARLEGDLRLVELAREAGLSTSHFVRSFRQSTGKTPYRFLLERRVKHAQDLMRDRRASLTEVALASGFADQHHLAHVFRRFTGITPSAYRRSL
jgi:AraC family transcriptional regulator